MYQTAFHLPKMIRRAKRRQRTFDFLSSQTRTPHSPYTTPTQISQDWSLGRRTVALAMGLEGLSWSTMEIFATCWELGTEQEDLFLPLLNESRNLHCLVSHCLRAGSSTSHHLCSPATPPGRQVIGLQHHPKHSGMDSNSDATLQHCSGVSSGACWRKRTCS